jgi:hypothetical protein
MSKIVGHRSLRVLAVDPGTRGFGYAVLEAPARLVEWGTKEIRQDKERVALRKIEELLGRYAPSVLVVEDCGHPRSRRNDRIAWLTEQMLDVAVSCGVAGCAVSRAAVYRNFAKAGARTKHEIASVLACKFPVLALRLPPKRKAWQPEDYRMGIFDAAAFGLTYLDRRRKPAKRPAYSA